MNCPGDGSCNNNGICNETSGQCICEEGYFETECSSK
jgi:hypothetical protein